MHNIDTYFFERLWLVLDLLMQKWRIVLLSVIVGMVIGAAIRISHPPLYKGVANIKIGRVGSVGMKIPDEYYKGGDSVEIKTESGVNVIHYGLHLGYRELMTSAELYRQLAIEYNSRRSRLGLVEPPYISGMNNVGDGLEITAKGKTKIQVERYLQGIVDKVLDEHEQKYQQLMEGITSAQSELIKQLETYQKKSVKKIPLNLVVEKGGSTELVDLSILSFEFEKSLSPSVSYPSSLFGELIIAQHRDRSVLLYILCGGVAGFALALNLLVLMWPARNQ